MDRQRGQVLVLFAILLPVLLAGVGLAVEGGFALAQRQRMQAAADLAAVNGAYCQLHPTLTMCSAAATYPGSGGSAARGMALSVATANGYDDATVTTPYAGDPTKVAVSIGEGVPTPLLGFIGFSGFEIAARAVAGVQSGIISASVVALNPTMCGAISLSGSSSIEVNIGAVQINSNCPTALSASGSASITAPAINVVGGYNGSGSSDFDPTPTTGVAPIPDPLASVPVPSTGGLTARTAPSCSSGSVTLQPGIYSSISFSGSCAAHLQPGTYYISSGGISVSGSARLDGDGVFMYNAGGAIDLSGTGAFDLTPPTSGPYKGLLLFQARTNASTLSLSGNGAIEGMHGTIYGPKMPVRISGNGNLPAQFVSDSLTMSGNGTLNIQYSASEVYGVPSMTLLE